MTSIQFASRKLIQRYCYVFHTTVSIKSINSTKWIFDALSLRLVTGLANCISDVAVPCQLCRGLVTCEI